MVARPAQIKKSTASWCFFCDSKLKLVPVFEPVSQLDRFLRAQVPERDSHGAPDHDRFRMHVADERFVLLERAW